MEKQNDRVDRIIVNNVSKIFYVFMDKANSLKEKMLFWKRNKRETREVLKDINLTIKNGEAVALIGVNGSGKSTLLKLMTKIIYPTRGEIVTKKQIDARLEEIIEFSELRDFIDNPVRTYSSGMFMRLAFAVAINVDADILLVDEILSVGDQHFQEKCLNKMKELKAQGKTMVFVTHSLGSARELCDRAVWLNKGHIQLDGDVNEVIDEYLKETT